MTSSESSTGQPNLTSISPFFIVKDLQASIAHYIERFGFTLDFQGPPDGVYYGHVSRDGIGIMLKAITPDVLPRPNHTRHEWARWTPTSTLSTLTRCPPSSRAAGRRL